MERNYKLYVHIAPNGKRYYGITKQKPEQRWKRGKSYKQNQHFTNAINKYGWDNIEHIVLHEGLDEDEAKELEQYMIQWYNTANSKYGYNQSLGGESNNGKPHSEETKQKLREANIGKKKHSEEHKQKLREMYAGKGNPNYGKHFSEETKKKLSESRKGEKNHMFHKHGKDNPFSKPVICLTTKRVFESQTNAGLFYNIKSPGNISQCCTGKIKSAGKLPDGTKLVWRYIDIIEL